MIPKYDCEIYPNEINVNEFLQKIEQEKQTQVLFGGVTGSTRFDLASVMSDYDVAFITQNHSSGFTWYHTIDYPNNTDINVLNLDFLLKDSQNYLHLINHRFPYVLYRTEEEVQRRWLIKREKYENKFNPLPECYTTEVLFNILSSNYIWNTESISKSIKRITEKVSLIGVIDTYYTKVYRYVNKYFQQDEIPAVCCLLVYHWIAIIRWLLEQHTVPCVDFRHVRQWYNLPAFDEYLQELYSMHKEMNPEDSNVREFGPKRWIVAHKNDVFCNWVYKELECIANILQKQGSVLENIGLEIGEDCFLSRLQNDD